jgi:hypothetical protein
MFTNLYKKLNKSEKVSKHQAGKKGFKHSHNLSKGQLKDYLKEKEKFLKIGAFGSDNLS